MTPLHAVPTVATDSTIDEAIGTVTGTNRERILVYDDETEDVGGIVTIHDLARATYRPNDTGLRTLVQPVIYVPSAKPVADLLGEMQDLRIRMAIIVTDDGSAKGVVTIDDIVEDLGGGMYCPSATS